MLEVLSKDYMTTARAKGLPKRVVTMRHGLRNALLPVVTILGMRLPGLIGGALFVESIFSYPGIGLIAIRATHAHDYPLLMGMTLMTAVAVLLSNLLADLLYGVVDPRIRYD